MFRRKGRDLRNVAALAVHKGKFAKALECYLSLEKLEPGEAEWSRRAAQMYERLDRKPEAIASLERACDKYRRAGFEAKANAVAALIKRIDPSYEIAEAKPAAAAVVTPPSEPRKRRRLAVGTERMSPPAGVQVAWAYHSEVSKGERVNLALSDLLPEERPSDKTPTPTPTPVPTESGDRRRR